MDVTPWWVDDKLIFPNAMIDAYKTQLQNSGLWEKNQGPRPDPAPVGGITKAQADDHFAHSYDGSLARAQLVYFNPTGGLESASATLHTFLTGGDLCLVDVPAGAGAATLMLLCSVALKRQVGLLPRQPLNVRILWGEISPPALEHGAALLADVRTFLISQAIFVTYETVEWNVLDQMSNQIIVEKIVLAKNAHPQVLLLVCNFSGFLERSGKWKEAENGLNQLFRFCSGDMNAALWLEPDQKVVRDSLIAKIEGFLAKILRFGRAMNAEDPSEAGAASYASPTVARLSPRVTARVMPIDLNRN